MGPSWRRGPGAASPLDPPRAGPDRAAQLLEAHGGGGRRSLWRIRRQAYGGMPCSIRIGLSLGLHVVSALVPS
jgi:hypothetical protein